MALCFTPSLVLEQLRCSSYALLQSTFNVYSLKRWYLRFQTICKAIIHIFIAPLGSAGLPNRLLMVCNMVRKALS